MVGGLLYAASMSTVTAKGTNGQLSFDGATVVITRDGFVARSTHGQSEKALPVSLIGAVQFKPASSLVNGFIQFSVVGEVSKRSVGFGKNHDMSRDENAIVFRKGANAEFEAVRDAVRAAQVSRATA